jgi:hypothetical protein
MLGAFVVYKLFKVKYKFNNLFLFLIINGILFLFFIYKYSDIFV